MYKCLHVALFELCPSFDDSNAHSAFYIRKALARDFIFENS